MFVLDKLSGLYLSKSHAVKVNSPVTFELVPIMLHNHTVESRFSAKTNDVHYLWLFGDEVRRNLILSDYFSVGLLAKGKKFTEYFINCTFCLLFSVKAVECCVDAVWLNIRRTYINVTAAIECYRFYFLASVYLSFSLISRILSWLTTCVLVYVMCSASYHIV